MNSEVDMMTVISLGIMVGSLVSLVAFWCVLPFLVRK